MSSQLLWSADVTSALLPPLLPGIPVLGNALGLTGDSRQFLLDAYRRLGPIFRVRAMNKTMTVMVGPEANQFFAQAGSKYLRSRELWQDFAVETNADHQLNGIDGESHAWQRKVMKPGFSRNTILGRLGDVEAIVEQAAAALAPGQQIHVLPFMQQLVTEQLGLLLTGRSPKPYVADIRWMMRASLNALVIRQWPRAVLLLPSYRRAKARVRELAQAVIAEHRATHDPGRTPDLIDDLLAAHAAEPTLFTERDLLLGAVGPYIAGLDTVANACTFLIYALLSHTEVLRRVQNEVDQVFAKGPLTAQALKELPALHGAAMETMRVYPITPAMQRTATHTFTFADHRVDADTSILFATGVTHLLPDLFPEPQQFDIERYHAPRNEHRKPGSYAPFGLGAHTCLGAGLAEVQIMVTIATLLHNVSLEPILNYRPRIRLDPTLTLGPSYRVRVLRPRST